MFEPHVISSGNGVTLNRIVRKVIFEALTSSDNLIYIFHYYFGSSMPNIQKGDQKCFLKHVKRSTIEKSVGLVGYKAEFYL